MTEEVVKRVEALAKKDGIPTKLSFIFRHSGEFVTDADALLAGVDSEQQQQNQNNDYDDEEDYQDNDEANFEMDDSVLFDKINAGWHGLLCDSLLRFDKCEMRTYVLQLHSPAFSTTKT